MKVLHVCICGPFTDGLSYQENELIEQHVELGHDVTVIAATDTYGPDKKVMHTEPGNYRLLCGAHLIRLPYAWGLRGWLATKLRAHLGMRESLEAIRPERIIFHGLCAWDLMTVSKYSRCNDRTVLYADSHEDFNNSSRTWMSRWLLHHLYYRSILKLALPGIDGLLCVSTESVDFVNLVYGVCLGRLEYFPLGGKLWSDGDYIMTRERVRKEFGWGDDVRVFVQSGKIDAAKRLDQTLDAFAQISDPRARLVIAGQLFADVHDVLAPRIESEPRITHLGWVDPQRLRELLCAADAYVQPGSQSATMQMALCCRRPVILDDVPSHRALISDNGILVNNRKQLVDAVAKICAMSSSELLRMSGRSAEVAARLLDYKKQAERLLLPQ